MAVGGACSPILPIISGVPQGSVLGPLLFLIYINDVVNQISPGSSQTMSLFADDMALYRPIHSTTDYSILQLDIYALSTWIKNNSLSLQLVKCWAMLISRKRSCFPAPPALFVEGVPLPYVTSVKYLGISITSSLSWSQHITNVHSKARKLIGVLFRKFYKNAQSSTLLQLYKSFIRPHMEYCSPVWDPHLTKDTMLLENAQKFGLRVCLKDWSSSYEELLCKANLPPPPPPPPPFSAVLWQECITCIKLFMILLTFLKCLWKDGSSTTAVEPTILQYSIYCAVQLPHNTIPQLLLSKNCC